MPRTHCTTLALITVLALGTRVEAQARRPLYAGAGLGPAVLVTPYGGCCDTHFRTEGELGWHPSGQDSGFFLAANATFMIGRDWLVFFPGLRLGGDIEVFAGRDLAVLLTPSGMVGGGIFDIDGRPGAVGFFGMQPAFALKFALLARLLQIWVRPVAFDLLFFPTWYDDDFEFHAIYSFVAGVFFAF